MAQDITLKGMIKGTEQIGAKFVKINDTHTHIYFKVLIGGELDNDVAIQRCRQAYKNIAGLWLEISMVATLDDGEQRPPKQDEPIFSMNQIQQLQNKVHAITGDSKVMMLFNELLGVSAG